MKEDDMRIRVHCLKLYTVVLAAFFGIPMLFGIAKFATFFSVSAQSCPASSCAGSIDLNIPHYCSRLADGSCKTVWQPSKKTFSCDANCNYNEPLAPSGCDPATCELVLGRSGTCCINSSNPTPTTAGGGGGGGGVPSGECDATCYNDEDCSGSLVCHGEGPTNPGKCRNASCTTSESCQCGSGNGCGQACNDVNAADCPAGKTWSCYTNECRNPWCKNDVDCTCDNPVCTISISADTNPLLTGSSTTIRATVKSESNGGIDVVTFTATNSAVATFTNGTILSNGSSRVQSSTRVNNQYTAPIMGVSVGSTKVTATGSVQTEYGTQSCSSQLLLTDYEPLPFCRQIYFYKVTGSVTNAASWQQITLNDIAQGDTIYIGAEGDLNGSTETFDRARFYISSSSVALESSDTVAATNIYYVQYVVPTGISEFTVASELHGVNSDAWY